MALPQTGELSSRMGDGARIGFDRNRLIVSSTVDGQAHSEVARAADRPRLLCRRPFRQAAQMRLRSTIGTRRLAEGAVHRVHHRLFPVAPPSAKRCIPAVAVGGWGGCSQTACTLIVSVSTGRTGVSLAAQARTVPDPSRSSSFKGAARATSASSRPPLPKADLHFAVLHAAEGFRSFLPRGLHRSRQV